MYGLCTSTDNRGDIFTDMFDSIRSAKTELGFCPKLLPGWWTKRAFGDQQQLPVCQLELLLQSAVLRLQLSDPMLHRREFLLLLLSAFSRSLGVSIPLRLLAGSANERRCYLWITRFLWSRLTGEQIVLQTQSH